MHLRKFFVFFIMLFFSTALFLQCPPEIPDETPPIVNIIYPVEGQAVSGTVKVSVGATDETELKQIDLYIDGERIASSPGPLLEYVWNTVPIADNRNHSLSAIATDDSDNNGFSGTVTVRVVSGNVADTLAPVITILNPVTGSTVRDTVTVTAQVVDDSPIERVDYYVDGKLDFSATQSPFDFFWNVQTFDDGTTHNLYARAYDINGNTGISNIVSVTIQNNDNIPPTVLIIYPTAGSVFSIGDTVAIRADAQDNFGIQRLEFYIDGELKITDTSRPYSYLWDTTGYTTGQTHTIYVKAFDLSQNSSSQLITVTVNP
ncbi:MAG: hypothetical protein JXL67_06490 [Calditrichaeota bacterium]|nr:hypothetical protein [Calditrichota bacterium]